MSINHPIYFFYIGACLFYIVDILQKITSAHVNTFAYLMRRSVYTSVVSVVGSLLISGISSIPSFGVICQIAGCSIVTYGGIHFYIKAIHHLQFSNANSIFIVGNAVQQLTGILLFHEPFHSWMILSWLLMSFGCIYQMVFTTWSKGAWYVLVSSICWTAGYSLLSLVLKNGYEMWSVAIMESTILVVSFVLLTLTQGRRKESISITYTRKQMVFFSVIAISLFAASYFNHLSFRYNALSIISLMQLSMMPISFILNMRIFKEKPSMIEWISLGTGIAGFLVFVVFS